MNVFEIIAKATKKHNNGHFDRIAMEFLEIYDEFTGICYRLEPSFTGEEFAEFKESVLKALSKYLLGEANE